MSEDIYRNEDKGFIVTRYCGKNGVAMYQITNVRAGKPTIFSGGMKARSRKQPQNI
jgi:hypothetical protein